MNTEQVERSLTSGYLLGYMQKTALDIPDITKDSGYIKGQAGRDAAKALAQDEALFNSPFSLRDKLPAPEFSTDVTQPEAVSMDSFMPEVDVKNGGNSADFLASLGPQTGPGGDGKLSDAFTGLDRLEPGLKREVLKDLAANMFNRGDKPRSYSLDTHNEANLLKGIRGSVEGISDQGLANMKDLTAGGLGKELYNNLFGWGKQQDKYQMLANQLGAVNKGELSANAQKMADAMKYSKWAGYGAAGLGAAGGSYALYKMLTAKKQEQAKKQAVTGRRPAAVPA